MIFSLQNKNTVITGAGSGIGKATALLFAQQKAVVHVIDLNEEAANQTVHEIKENGGEAFALVADVTNQQQVVDAFNAIEKINVLVNSAGISHIGKIETTTEEDFERIFKVNVKGMYNCLYAVVPVMKRNNGGAIVNLCSVVSHVGIPDRFAYTMSKGAVHGMTLSVAKDYIHDNIRCNSVSPARVHTQFVDNFLAKNYPGHEKEMFEKLSKTQPIGRMASPQEVAYLILYLCSNEASFITGCDYPVDGGFIKLNN